MKEAATRSVEWIETDVATFGRFAQFAYTGNYDGLEQPEQAILDKQREKAPDWSGSLGTSKKKKKLQQLSFFKENPGSESAQHQFETMCPDHLCKHDAVRWDKEQGVVAETEMLLTHIRMYVLADYHDIVPLRALTLRKLHRILIQFPVNDDSVASIIELVQFSYENTRTSQGEALRDLVSTYGACTLFHFEDNDAVDLLIRSVPDFAGDLFQKIDR